MIAISVIIVFALLYFLFFNNNKNEQSIMSILELPFPEDLILKKESRAQSDSSIVLILSIDHGGQVEKSSKFDIASYEGSKLYDDLVTLINENDMSINEAKIWVYHVEHRIKAGFFSVVSIPHPVYLITGNGSHTLVYTIIPEGVVLPLEYLPK